MITQSVVGLISRLNAWELYAHRWRCEQEEKGRKKWLNWKQCSLDNWVYWMVFSCTVCTRESEISNLQHECGKKKRWLGGSMYWPDEVQNRNSQWCGSAKWLRLRIPHMGSRGLHVQVQDQAVSNCFPPLLVIVWRGRTKRGWKCGLVGFSYVCVSYIKELVAVEKCAGKIL